MWIWFGDRGDLKGFSGSELCVCVWYLKLYDNTLRRVGVSGQWSVVSGPIIYPYKIDDVCALFDSIQPKLYTDFS